jgi:bifunctional non-homologous end joining protein LigD
VSGRSMDEIAEGKGKKRVWHSNRAADPPSGSSRSQTQREFKAQLRAAAESQTKKSSKSRAKGATSATTKVTTKQKRPPRAAAARRSSAKPAAVAAARKRSAPAQRRSGTGRLPDFIPPSLATLHDKAPSGPQWIHEIKFDGYRIEARLDQGKVKLLTRKELDWTHRFERIAKAVAALPAETALLDGELVVENDKGVSSFSMLQNDLKEGRGDRFVYWVFDLLYLDGRNLADAPLIERKAALRRLLKGSKSGPIRYAEHFDGDGPVIFKHACDMNLEGLVSKRRQAPYGSGR